MLTRKATPGLAVSNRRGHRGVISSVNAHIVKVVWSDGTWSDVPASSLHPIGGPRWPAYLALSLGLTIIAIVFAYLMAR